MVLIRLSPERPHLIYKGGACHQRALPQRGYQIIESFDLHKIQMGV